MGPPPPRDLLASMSQSSCAPRPVRADEGSKRVTMVDLPIVGQKGTIWGGGEGVRVGKLQSAGKLQ